MRRTGDRQSSKLFRGSEFADLAMIGMLLILTLIIGNARDAGPWRFVTGQGLPAAQGEEPPADAASGTDSEVSSSEAGGTVESTAGPAHGTSTRRAGAANPASDGTFSG